MSKKRRSKNDKKPDWKREKVAAFLFHSENKRYIGGIAAIVIAIITFLSFFERSGPAGEGLKRLLFLLVGKAFFIVPILFLLASFISFRPRYNNFVYSLILAEALLLTAVSGILEGLNPGNFVGGWWGYLIATPLLKLFDFLVTQVIFLSLAILSFLILWHLLEPYFSYRHQKAELAEGIKMIPKEEIVFGSRAADKGESIVTKMFQKVVGVGAKFKVKEVPSFDNKSEEKIMKGGRKETDVLHPLKTKSTLKEIVTYSPPPTSLLEKDGGKATPGDIKEGAAIIKKTLQNFGIAVEMAEVNIGPTVTQYTLKPAEGIKLSKITALNNDLALALAAHPIRIEAPIPGKSLVGIEVPNKMRAKVRLRELIESESFQQSPPLTIALGRDVSGGALYADLARMPHLLVAGSTGSGKTIFLNSLILSLLYKNSPNLLRFILIDPKRVELVVYNNLPHLLSPVIFDATQTVNALKWLIGEMERRFDVLSVAKSRDIMSYNSKIEDPQELMPNIVLVVDELADLMAAKGREMEAGIVRLAQMARAVGIHLVVATQRPSVEVITGLIKANITSRIAFQVASQVDSRTILDAAGAEKLLGSGDFLYLSPEVGKPKRIQAAFVSEKEVRKVTDYIRMEAKNNRLKIDENVLVNHLGQELQEALESDIELNGSTSKDQDPLYEAAKREVILARKASASLLQRRLRIGYARAARLLDMLEQNGVIGPGEGAKPREVYITERIESELESEERKSMEKGKSGDDTNEEWKKI